MTDLWSGRADREDTLYEGDELEEAHRLHDPTHVRTYTEEEWRRFLAQARLRVEAVDIVEKRRGLEAWLERTRCTGDKAAKLREFFADRLDEHGKWGELKILIKARKR